MLCQRFSNLANIAQEKSWANIEQKERIVRNNIYSSIYLNLDKRFQRYLCFSAPKTFCGEGLAKGTLNLGMTPIT